MSVCSSTVQYHERIINFFIISYFSFRFTTHSLTHQSTFLDEGWRQQTTTPISFFSIVLDLVTPPLVYIYLQIYQIMRTNKFCSVLFGVTVD